MRLNQKQYIIKGMTHGTGVHLVVNIECCVVCVVDAGVADRYHCSHSAGVHSVMLPWAHQFQQFCNAGKTNHSPTSRVIV